MYFPGYEEVERKIAEVLPAVREHVDEGRGVPDSCAARACRR